MPSFTVKDPRNPEATLDVEFEVESWGSPARTFCLPEDSDPGEPPEITLGPVLDITGANVACDMTDGQLEAIETAVIEGFDFDRGAEHDDDWY